MSAHTRTAEEVAMDWHRSNLEAALVSMIRCADRGVVAQGAVLDFARAQVGPGKRDEYRERAESYRGTGIVRAEREAVGR